MLQEDLDAAVSGSGAIEGEKRRPRVHASDPTMTGSNLIYCLPRPPIDISATQFPLHDLDLFHTDFEHIYQPDQSAQDTRSRINFAQAEDVKPS